MNETRILKVHNFFKGEKYFSPFYFYNLSPNRFLEPYFKHTIERYHKSDMFAYKWIIRGLCKFKLVKLFVNYK